MNVSLTGRERDVLRSACATLIPALPAEADPHGLFARAASALGVPDAVEQTLTEVSSPQQWRQVRQLLDLLDQPALNLLHAGRWASFRALDVGARAAVLRAWSRSPVAAQRQGFQLLKRLAAFFFYSLPGADGGPNPNWAAIGYPGRRPDDGVPRATGAAPGAGGQPVRPLRIERDTVLEADVCVVGSGAGGGVVAAELAAAGRSVIVLEQGGQYEAHELPQSELQANRDLYMRRGMFATADLGVSLLAGSCLGGGTLVNWCSSFRPPGWLLDEWEREHGVEGITGPAFQRGLDRIEERLHVHDRESEFAADSNSGRLAAGCRALGHHCEPMRRNVEGCGDCGWCGFGCPREAKRSTAVTFLRDAAARGARFVVRCSARRVLLEDGSARGVEAEVSDPASGRSCRLTVRCRAVVVAGGSIGSPALLLRSGLENPAIGRHLHLHPTSVVNGFFPEPVDPWRGVPQGCFSDRFTQLDGPWGFKLETAPAHPGIIAAATPWESGEQHKRRMARCRHEAIMIVLVRDRGAGRVRVDRRGEPVVEYALSAYDRRHLLRGLREGAAIHAAAGAKALSTLHQPPLRVESPEGFDRTAVERLGEAIAARPPGSNRLALFSAHQMGTCRMGSNPRTSVCGPWGEVHGVRGLFVADASLFPSATGVNPMITIMGLATRVAGAIKHAL